MLSVQLALIVVAQFAGGCLNNCEEGYVQDSSGNCLHIDGSFERDSESGTSETESTPSSQLTSYAEFLEEWTNAHQQCLGDDFDRECWFTEGGDDCTRFCVDFDGQAADDCIVEIWQAMDERANDEPCPLDDLLSDLWPSCGVVCSNLYAQGVTGPDDSSCGCQSDITP